MNCWRGRMQILMGSRCFKDLRVLKRAEDQKTERCAEKTGENWRKLERLRRLL